MSPDEGICNRCATPNEVTQYLEGKQCRLMPVHAHAHNPNRFEIEFDTCNLEDTLQREQK